MSLQPAAKYSIPSSSQINPIWKRQNPRTEQVTIQLELKIREWTHVHEKEVTVDEERGERRLYI
jgi:hypothetical protein